MRATLIGFVGSLALLVVASITGLSAGLNRWLTDAHWAARAPLIGEPFGDVVVVAIDDKTLKATDPATGQPFGRPGDWSRERYARLLGRLGQAKAVGLDFLFYDPARDTAGDEAFFRAVKAHGRCVIAFNQWRGERALTNNEKAGLARLLGRCSAAPELRAELAPLERRQLQAPLGPLLDGAAALGYVDVAAGLDGVYRRVTLARRVEDRVVPHFALAVAATAAGREPAQALRAGPLRVELPGRAVRLSEGRLTLQPVAIRADSKLRRGHRVPTVSFVDALEAAPETFRGKLVLVGETASGTTDVRPNPLDRGLRGVEFNAEILVNVLYLPPVRSLAPGAMLVLVLLAIGLPLWLYAALEPRLATLGAVLSTLGVVAALEAVFWYGHRVPAWSPALLGALGSTLLMGLQRLLAEEQQKQAIRRSFSMYVAPELVAMIAEDPEMAQQEGRYQTLCVLFSDIRSFTTYCEANPPALVVRQMREYMSEMTEAVDAYRGVLDKFIGDCVMALFGPFLEPEANPAALGVGCALDMLARLERLNEAWREEGLPELQIGVGLHYGKAIVGNIGSERKMQYTALGDTVNTAARLESATKELHAAVVVSEEARALAEPLVDAWVTFEPLGEIAVRNRAKPVVVFSAVPRADGG